MEALALFFKALEAVVGILLVFAVLEIFSVSRTLRKILAQLEKSDRNRREEFEALSDGE